MYINNDEQKSMKEIPLQLDKSEMHFKLTVTEQLQTAAGALTVALSAAVACRRVKPIDSIIDMEPSSGTNCCAELPPGLASCRGESKSASVSSTLQHNQ